MEAKRQRRLVAGLFFTVILFELLGEALLELAENPVLVYITKPLMMPLLALYFMRSISAKKMPVMYKFILAALFFSWLGDLFLMVTSAGENLFLYGLGAFLIAHLMYINAFRYTGEGKPFLLDRPLAVLPVVLYCAGLIFGLYRYGSVDFLAMKYPVMLYAGVIMVMVLSSLNRKNRVPEVSFILVFAGALLFMFSDSLIAANKFTSTFEDIPLLVRVLIMSTYALGQYLIVEGMIWDYGNR